MAFDVEAATQAYLNTLDAAARARSDAYFEGGYLILVAGALISCLIFWALLHLGWASRLARWAACSRSQIRRWSSSARPQM